MQDTSIDTPEQSAAQNRFASVPRVAFSIPEFSARFGRGRHWGYRMVAERKVRVIDGYGQRMIPASEVDRILTEGIEA